MTLRCEATGLELGSCAGACCRPDLKQYQPIPEVWMKVTEPAGRPVVPAPSDIRAGNVHALLQVVSGRTGRPDVFEMVRELCEESSHLIRYELQQTAVAPAIGGRKKAKGKRQRAGRKADPKYHRTVEPPLMEQLWASSTPSGSAEAGTARPASSRPAARLDGLDTAAQIDNAVDVWLNLLDVTDVRVSRRRPAGAPLTESEMRLQDSITRLRRLGSLIPSLDRCGHHTPARDLATLAIICCPGHRLESDFGRWWTWARVVTGWDTPAWQPANTCPLCGVRGTLRVRLDEQRATCVNGACRETWDQFNIGLLAEHIRRENNDTEEAS